MKTCKQVFIRNCTMWAMASAFTVSGSLCAADTKLISLDIKGQKAVSALLELSRTSGHQIVLAQNAGEDVELSAIKGEYSLSSALDVMLKNSGLEYEFVSDNSVLIRRESEKKEGNKADKNRNDSIEEIMVTAQKREQSVTDVPMSIGVLGEAEIENKGVDNILDISFSVPGVMVREEGPGRQTMYMRGIGNNNGTDVLTSVYLDEAPVNTGGGAALNAVNMLGLRTTDLERIEVLRGPQGTLYGSGAVSGTVRFITKDPQLDRFGGSGDVELSYTKKGDPSQEVKAVVNVPLVEDVLGIRIASTLAQLGGWIDQPAANSQDINNQDLADVRIKALWRLTDSFDAKAMVIVHRNESDVGTSISDEDYVFRPAFDLSKKIPFHDNSELYNLTMTYDAEFAQLLSSSTYIDQQQESIYTYKDTGATFFPGYEGLGDNDRYSKVFTQEVRMTSSDDDSLSWTVGAFYRDREERLTTVWDIVFGGVEFGSFNDNISNSKSWAVFGDASYIFADGLEVGGGVRYFSDDRASINFVRQEAFSGTFDAVTWRSYISYDLADNVKTYVNIGTGFRSGGFNPFGAPPYESENLLSYEVGAKMSLFDKRLNMDVALFYSDYQDMLQRSLWLVDGQFVGVQANIGKASVQGADANFVWYATDNFILNFSGSVSNGQIDKADLNNPSGSRPGDPLDYVPDYSYSVGAEYQFDWTSEVSGFVRMDFNGRGKVTVIDRTTMPDIGESDTVSFLNARLGAEFGNWVFHIFGDNLLNEYGSLDPWRDWGITLRPRPRTIGIKVGVDFD